MRILMLQVHTSILTYGVLIWFPLSGLDNAGKTTIVKKIMNEDVNTVSPTLGFIIKTIDFEGYALFLFFDVEILTDPLQVSVEYMYVTEYLQLQPAATNHHQGTQEGKKPFDPTGKITLRRLTL